MKRRQFVWCLAALIAPSLLAGCHTLQPDVDQETESGDATMGTSFRPPSKNKEKFFFDKRAQEIEASLGM